MKSTEYTIRILFIYLFLFVLILVNSCHWRSTTRFSAQKKFNISWLQEILFKTIKVPICNFAKLLIQIALSTQFMSLGGGGTPI